MTAAGAWTGNNVWDAAAEEAFSKWVGQLGAESAKRPGYRLDACFNDPAVNGLHQPGDAPLAFFADCADVPVVLRAYFSYKTRRPFQYVSAISGDRYTAGNHPTAWRDFTQFADLPGLIHSMVDAVDSGFYRIAPEVEGTDTYPVDVSRDSVRPGTVFYDPNGHVLVVYQVEDGGLVRLMDGHPDNSLTHTVFGEKFVRGGAGQGGGFRGWRSYRVEATPSGLQFIRATNAALPHYSGDAQHRSTYDVGGGQTGSYYDWVRARLTLPGARVNLVQEFEDKLSALCVDVRGRVAAVQAAVSAGIPMKGHPPSLPDNIYGTTGDWEAYATCSRDARLKAAFRELHRFVGTAAASVNPQALADSFTRIARSDAGRCTWIDSKGGPHTLAIDEVGRRLFFLSFDCYHGPEMRWGARPGGGADGSEPDPDFLTATDEDDSTGWYWQEQRLRNLIDRTEGPATPLDAGPEEIPDYDIAALLRSLGATLGT